MGIVFIENKLLEQKSFFYLPVFVKFSLQLDTNLDACDKTSTFMITAQLTYWVDDLIHIQNKCVREY